MKTVLDQTTRGEIIDRINSLGAESTAKWGKMNIGQMLTHCTRGEQMALGHLTLKRSLIGRLFGRIALKSVLKNEKPLDQNLPTATELKITAPDGEVEQLKQKWAALVEEYTALGHHEVIHPFFGKMTKDQVGQLSYKHADHHLRQFGA